MFAGRRWVDQARLAHATRQGEHSLLGELKDEIEDIGRFIASEGEDEDATKANIADYLATHVNPAKAVTQSRRPV